MKAQIVTGFLEEIWARCKLRRDNELQVPIFIRDWPFACTMKRRGHSEKRSTLISERGGRGLLVGWRRSFPPASEREARMDDPTPRLKSRETECPLGAPVPKQEPRPFSRESSPAAQPTQRVAPPESALAAARAPLRCPSGATRHIRTKAASFLRPRGSGVSRTYWRIHPALAVARASTRIATRK